MSLSTGAGLPCTSTDVYVITVAQRNVPACLTASPIAHWHGSDAGGDCWSMHAAKRIGHRAIWRMARFRAQRGSESAGSVTRLEGAGVRTRARVPSENSTDSISQTFGFRKTARFGPCEFPPTAGSAANLF